MDEVRSGGRRVEHAAADLADPAAPRRLMAAARSAFGHVDVVVANHARSSRQSLEQLTAAELDLSYAVNTRATLLLVKEYAVAPDGDIDQGSVVLFTSGQHLRPGVRRSPIWRARERCIRSRGPWRRSWHREGSP